MTEQRIRTIEDMRVVWYKVQWSCKDALPIFRVRVENSPKFPGDGEQLLICKKENTTPEWFASKTSGALSFGLYDVSAELGHYGVNAMDPVFRLKDEGEKGLAYFEYKAESLSAVRWLENVKCEYTGQNYNDGETTLVFGSLDPYDEKVKGGFWSYGILRAGLSDLLERPDIILGRYYFYTTKSGKLDLSANRKGGYTKRVTARCAAVDWARENV